MKSAVFARPNLKAFLFGAILIALIQNFIANGHSQATRVHARDVANSEMDYLEQLLTQAENSPNSQVYARISRCYEKQGDMRKAILYLRRAQLLAQSEEADD